MFTVPNSTHMDASEEDKLFARFSLKTLEKELATAVIAEEQRVAVRNVIRTVAVPRPPVATHVFQDNVMDCWR